MGIVNRIVNIVILLLALVAVIFGSMLYNKRVELRDRGNKMAEMISKVSGVLDFNTETAYQKALVTTKLPIDKTKSADAEKNMKMSLYHDNFANLDIVLAPFKKQADDIIAQRDALGNSLKDIADKLEVPETFAPSHFQKMSTYDEYKAKLVGYAGKITDRDNALVDQLVKSGTVVGCTMQRESLKSLTDFAGPLGEFSGKVDALKKRADTLASAIGRMCQALELTAPNLAGDDYASALSNAETAVRGVKEELDRTKNDLTKVKGDLEKATNDLSQAQEKVTKLEIDNARLKKKIKEYENPDGIQTPGTEPSGNLALVKKLKGTVIDVNRKFDFVVIDLGLDNKVQVTIAGNVKDMPVSLPANSQWLVSRDDNFLAKIKVNKINQNCAIADILPDERKGEIKVGDKVSYGEGSVTGGAAPAPAAAAPAAN